MKLFTSICLVVVLAVASQAQAGNLKCHIRLNAEFNGWPAMNKPCIETMRRQIQMEIRASTQYLAMAAHFATDTVNRPGFAEYFIKAANEERQHASKLVEYLSMRGELTNTVNNLITVPTVEVDKWTGLSALEAAFKIKTEVTKSIRKLIQTCESSARHGEDEYHLVDYLSGFYLDEQLAGQRELAGQITTLEKMMNSHGHLGEFLFDKKM